MVFLEEVLFGLLLAVSRLVSVPFDATIFSLSLSKFRLLSISSASSKTTSAKPISVSEPIEAVREIFFLNLVPPFLLFAISIAAKINKTVTTAIKIIIHNLRRLAAGGTTVCLGDSSFIQ